MKNSPYFIILSVIIAAIIIGGAIIYSSKSTSNNSQGTPGTPTQESPPISADQVTEEDHIRGDASAPVTIIEYSDFQCSFCQKFHPTTKQVLDAYPGQVRLVYRHFPLDSIHPNARPAAEASECAAEQGTFWEFADALFDNQPRLGSDLYQEIATNLNLDLNQFNQCVSSRKYKDKVQADYQKGLSKGVTGTPGSFINGQPVKGAVPFEQLKSTIDSLL